ncbi:MAG: YebC/PmpR family DNA-binding transcriptional regulator [Clostridia bacterium]|nr:YebC/PmpR family DNA-binding transcriptional regulator [Clostridia bacterium]MBQ4249347.1 YebC/PmpR family DNA-binding transcriptional regulator [Clostridia bacterium]
MSGHSKWKNIMHKKGKTDAQRAKVFTKISKEMIIVIRDGGADPASNSKLRDLIAKAKQNNVPNDNIERLLKRAQEGKDSNNYEAMTYEGYGKSGVGIIVETLTDNKNRTAGEMRHYFDKFGAGLAAPGAVSWQFDKRGVIVVPKDAGGEDDVMMAALDAGALDFSTEDESYEILTAPEDFDAVRAGLTDAGFSYEYSEIEMVPQNYITVESEDDIESMRKLLEMLEDNDDVQNVYHNMENEPE